jgi:hypothetical protein
VYEEALERGQQEQQQEATWAAAPEETARVKVRTVSGLSTYLMSQLCATPSSISFIDHFEAWGVL